MPPWFRTHVFNCSTALIFEKPGSTSIRPTGVGFGPRRVISKAVLFAAKAAITNSMPQSQKGLDTKGVEIIVHTVRAVISRTLDPTRPLSDAPCLFQADEKNAFNSFSRELALRLAKQHWPQGVYDYVEMIYGSPNKVVLESNTVFADMGSNTVFADMGSTQGCAFGMAVYCLTNAYPLAAGTRPPTQAPARDDHCVESSHTRLPRCQHQT